jgi:hypothetical protein
MTMAVAVTRATRQPAVPVPQPSPFITCDATAPDTIVITFSEPVDPSTASVPPAIDPGNYTVSLFTGPGAPVLFPQRLLTGIASINLSQDATAAFVTLTQHVPGALTLTGGQYIQIVVNGNVLIRGRSIPGNSSFAQVRDVGDALGSIATNTGNMSQSVEDLAAFSLLTEEIGYPPSPLARPSGGTGAMAAGGTLGQIATKAVSDVLGWQIKTDPKGFLGALNASFALKEIDGHTEAIWTPRTYAIQTDLSGGITGAQASVYKRAKDALDQSLPLLDGLYPLFKEAKDEDVAALRATIRSQFTDLVNELGLLGGPRITRVTQLFFLLLGQQLPQNQAQVAGFPLKTDPDSISGSLGNLRVEFGFSIADDQINTVEDEQDVTNFRIVTDYVTSLAQSWLNNLQFFGLQTQTPFFGTQLVLLSRQLSVIAESANEVRFTLDSVFIGPAERQTLQINFGSPAPANTPSMFLEDLLSWIDGFASEEGPRLIQDGGKFAVSESFVPIGTQLQTLVAGAVTPANVLSLPRGYRTKRAQRSLEELRDQLQELVNLAAPISHVITPEPEPGLAVLGINPNFVFNPTVPLPDQPVTIIGTGFDVSPGPTVTVTRFDTSTNTTVSVLRGLVAASDSLIHATLIGSSLLRGSNELTVTVINASQPSATLVTNFTVLP